METHRTVFMAMMDMISRTTIRTKMNLQSKRGAYFYKIAKFIMHNIQYRMLRFWLRWDLVYDLSKVDRDERRREGNDLIDEIYEKRMNQLKVLKFNGID